MRVRTTLWRRIGFGYQIGTPVALDQAEKRVGKSRNNCDDPLWYLSEEEKKEPWARDMKKYVKIKKHAQC